MSGQKYVSLENNHPRTPVLSVVAGLAVVGVIATAGSHWAYSSSLMSRMSSAELDSEIPDQDVKRFSYTESEIEEMEAVFDIVVSTSDNLLAAKCEMTTDYAFCGTATCETLDQMTGACGCAVKSDTEGYFVVDAASLILITSPIYRQIVKAVEGGSTDTAKEALCSSLNEGTLFKSAGFDTKIGSFYYESSSDSSAQPLGSEALSTGTAIGSCMGAPCREIEWGDGCASTCVCLRYTTKDSEDDDDDDDTSTEQGCFKNLVAEGSTYPWTNGGLNDLLNYIQRTTEHFNDLESIMDTKYCNARCSVK